MGRIMKCYRSGCAKPLGDRDGDYVWITGRKGKRYFLDGRWHARVNLHEGCYDILHREGKFGGLIQLAPGR